MIILSGEIKKMHLYFVPVLALAAITTGSYSNKKKILCYYSKANEDRSEAYRLHPQDIDANLCTHVVYSFSIPDLMDDMLPHSFFRTLSTDGEVQRLVILRNQNPSLKLILSIGGWKEGSKRFSKIVSDEKDMKWFVQYIHDFVRYIEFNGIDINWQWPSTRHGGNYNDKRKFTDFIKALRSHITKDSMENNKPPLLLSVVLPAFKDILIRGFDMDTIAKEVDYLILLTMDYYSSTEAWINHHAPLYSLPYKHCNKEFNVDFTVQHYLKMGIEPSKIVLGIPFYGLSYTLENQYETDIGSNAEDEGLKGFATNEPGLLAYFEICKFIKDFGWSVEYANATALGPYAYHRKNWVAYDDLQIIKKKVEYANSKCLGGVMLWTIDMDDFNGLCSEKFPLLKTVKESLLSTNNIGSSCIETLSTGDSSTPTSRGRPNGSRFKILTRAKWQASQPTEEIPKLRISPAPYVIIAHTVSGTCNNFEECKSAIKNIQSFHISLDYGDIGYSFLVGGDGNVYEGLGWDLHGAHSIPFNARSICIAFIGDFSNVRPPQKQIDAALKLIAEGVKMGKITTDYKIFGQRQVISVVSPGNALMEEIKTWPHWTTYDPIEDDED